MTIERDIKIKADPTVGAKIIGGGKDDWSILGWGRAASGPFKVRNFGLRPPQGQKAGDTKPVIFEGVHFSEWKGQAILVEACQGCEVRQCLFTRPSATTLEDSKGRDFNFIFEFEGKVYPLRFVHAILATGPHCKGHFIAEDNHCNFFEPPTNEPLAHDENFLACVMSAFDFIRIENNSEVVIHDDGIGVLLNRGVEFGDSSAIHVNNNHIVIKKMATWETPRDREDSKWWS